MIEKDMVSRRAQRCNYRFVTKNFRLHDEVREQLERRIRFALGRFAGRISS